MDHNKKWLSLWHYPAQLLQITLVTLCNVAVVCVGTLYFSWFTDLLVGTKLETGVVWKALIGYLVLQCVMELVNYSYQLGFAYVRSKLCISIRDHLTKAVFEDLNPGSFEKITKERITSVIINDVKTLRGKYISNQMTAIRVGIRLATFCGMIFYFNGWLGCWMLLVVAVLFFVSRSCNKAMEKYGLRQAQEKESYLKGYQDCLDGREDFKYAEKDSLLKNKMNTANEKLENVTAQCGKMRVRVSSLHTLSRFAAKATFIGIELVLAVHGKLSIGNIIASLSVFSLIEDEIGAAQNVLQTLAETRLVQDRIYQMVETWKSMTQTRKDSLEDMTLSETWSCFGMQNVSYSYDKIHPVLQGVSMSFQRGKKYLIVGESGNGKSTILKIMLGVCQPDQGNVFVDDMLLPPGSEELLSLASYLDQNFYLFQDTVENNIFFEREDYKKNLEATGYRNILERYVPDLTKKIEKNGSNLSGGQRQVIGIARMLASGKKVMILDESFSALDEKIFGELLNFLKQMKDVTLLIVSHRSQIQQEYDTVYEVSKGKVYEKQVD
jgi:ABC-type bacteriocin/lantibiotic exporter with double-glycine peptidase domain